MQPIARPSEIPVKTQAALWDLMAISINTSNSCSTTNGPRPDTLTRFLVALAEARRVEKK